MTGPTAPTVDWRSDLFTIVSTWSFPSPEDEAAFEEHYASSHAPLAQAVPGLIEFKAIHTGRSRIGEKPAFYRAVWMTWPDQKTFEAATETDQWRALHADGASVVKRFGVKLFTAMGEPQTLEPTAER